MIDKLVSQILQRILGQYVENIDTDMLNISVWKGELTLENLRLKRGALDALNIPVTVTRGILGKIVLKIPWSRLKTESVIADVYDIIVVARPKKACEV